MRWPWCRRRDRGPSTEALDAQVRAAADLATANERTSEIVALARQLHEARMRNHFGEALTASFERRR